MLEEEKNITTESTEAPKQSLMERITTVPAMIGMFVTLCIAALTFVHAAGRYLFDAPISGVVELTNLGTITCIFLTICYTMARNEHVSVGLVVDSLKLKAQDVVELITSTLSLSMIILMVYETLIYAPSQLTQVTQIRHISKMPFFYVVAIGTAIMGIALIYNMITRLKRLGKVTIIVAFVVAVALVLVVKFFTPFNKVLYGGNKLAIGVLGIAFMLLLILAKMPVGMAMGFAGMTGLALYLGWNTSVKVAASVPFSSLYNYSWSTVPMFVTMGFLAKETGLATDFYNGIRAWIGHKKGGLVNSIIIANAAFGACSGDSVGACVTFCSMSLPETRRHGYDDGLTLGAIAGSAVLSCLIPPSLLFIVYGSATQNSIGQLFIAGIIPGLLLVVMYMILTRILCTIHPEWAPLSEKLTLKERLQASPGMISLILVFVVIIGGIYLGLFTPTEAGSMGIVTVVIIGLIRRRLTVKAMKDAMVQSASTLGMVGWMLGTSMILQQFIISTGIPTAVEELLTQNANSLALFWILVLLICFVLGMFIDALPLLLLVAPILYPIALDFGIDPIHFGVVLTVLMLIGSLTPPVGMIVYAMAGVAKGIPMSKLFRSVMPWIVTMVIFCVLIMFIPELSTFLVSLAF